MAEILFRGRRTDSRQWVYGYLVIDACENPNPYIITGRKHRIEHKSIDRYTGMLDKNGERIFEGDVCRFREWIRGEMCWVGSVHYEHQQFVIYGRPNKECKTPFCLRLSRFVAGNIEVIGTIHDNPELLEAIPDE